MTNRKRHGPTVTHKIRLVFQVMRCVVAQKVNFSTYMLGSDAEHRWNCAMGGSLALGIPIKWDRLKEVFLEKCFLHSVRIQKEAEFLQLCLGDMTVAEYVAKFESLTRFSPNVRDNPVDH